MRESDYGYVNPPSHFHQFLYPLFVSEATYPFPPARIKGAEGIPMHVNARAGTGSTAMSTSMVYLEWICRIAAAVILLQTLFFKFTGAPESVYIFTQVGAEPWGRIGSGVVELIAAVLLFVPRFGWAGAGLALGVMAGAILSHLTILGIEVQSDKGLLFGLAITVAATSSVVLFLQRSRIPFLGERL